TDTRKTTPGLRAGALDGVDEAAGQGRDPAHALQEVQGDPFGLDDSTGRAAHDGQLRAGREAVPVGGPGTDPGGRVGEPEGRGEHVQAGEHPVLAGAQLRGGGGVGGQEHLAGEVAPGGVLGERGAHDAIDLGGGQHASTSEGESRRWWAPTETGRASAWAVSSRARSSRLRSSSAVIVVRVSGPGGCQVASCAAAASSSAPVRSRPTRSHISPCSWVRVQPVGDEADASTVPAAATSAATTSAAATPVAAASAAAASAAAASAARAPNTAPSSSEFEASRFAPCTPVRAHSPAASSPGRELRPSRS